MKNYEFKIRIEGLISSKYENIKTAAQEVIDIKFEELRCSRVSSAEYIGSLVSENLESASQEVINLAKHLNGNFSKFTLTLEEK